MKIVTRAWSVAVLSMLGGALCGASVSASRALAAAPTAGIQLSSPCLGGASLSGWYGMLISGDGKYLSGAVFFDGNCNVSGANVSGGSNGRYGTTSVTGSYNQNLDGTFNLILNLGNESTPETYVVGVSESGNKARGIESDNVFQAVIDIQSQITTQTAGYSTASLSGPYAASCAGPATAHINYVTFDGYGKLTGVDAYSNGGYGNSPYSGTYSVNSDGTFQGSLTGSYSGYSFSGVIEDGVSQIEYTYAAAGSGGVLACVGKQAQASAPNLLGWYGFVVGGASQSAAGGEFFSGAVYFDGAGNLSGSNVNGDINRQFGNTPVTGSYVVNGDQTISLTMNLANPGITQTYLVGLTEAGNEAVGIKTDGSAITTIDLQSQIQVPAMPYSNASLNGTYAASCTGSEIDLNYTTFDGNGNIIYPSVDAYEDGGYGDNLYTGTYTVNPDGTFSANFDGVYNVFTLTGVIENGNAEIEFSYDQSGVGGRVSCIGESTYGASGTNPVAAAPSFSPAPGAYSAAQTVSLTSATPGTVIYYTTNGTAPSTSSTIYGGPIVVGPSVSGSLASATTTIQAIALAAGYNNSALAAGTYFYPPSPTSQTIAFPNIPSQSYPAGAITLNATASSGLPVSFAIVSGPATVSGNQLTITGAGTVTVQASQAGNTRYAAAAAVSQTFIVNQESTTLGLSSSSNPSLMGQPVTFTATITPQSGGQASGTVTFTNGAAVLSVAPVSGNTAQVTVNTLAGGANSIAAVYSGDVNFTGSDSSALAQVVNRPTTTLISSVNPSVAGKPVTFTATVPSTTGPATGTVKFLDGAGVLAIVTLKSGVATYTTAKLPPGANVITVEYSGGGTSSNRASLPLSQNVLAVTTTTIASSPNPSAYGQTAVLTATVTSSLGAPSDGGTVAFKTGTTVLGTGVLSGGTATLSIATLGVGTKVITAVYGGGANFSGSSPAKLASQIVAKAASATTLTSSQPASAFGQAVTFAVTVAPQFSGTPTGTVIFKDGAAILKSVPLSEGSASFTTIANLARGTHKITANYGGDANFVNSTAALTQTVN